MRKHPEKHCCVLQLCYRSIFLTLLGRCFAAKITTEMWNIMPSVKYGESLLALLCCLRTSYCDQFPSSPKYPGGMLAAQQLKLSTGRMFQQDDPLNISIKSTTGRFQKMKIHLSEWPSQTPGHNPIKVLLNDFKTPVQFTRDVFKCVWAEQLSKEKCSKHPPQHCTSLIQNYQRCLIKSRSCRGTSGFQGSQWTFHGCFKLGYILSLQVVYSGEDQIKFYDKLMQKNCSFQRAGRLKDLKSLQQPSVIKLLTAV